MSQNSNMNLLEMITAFSSFLKRKIALILLIVIFCFGIAAVHYFLTKPYYKYQMIINSNEVSPGDVILSLKKMNDLIETDNALSAGFDWSKEDLASIVSLDVIKQYGSMSENVVYEIELNDTTLVSDFEERLKLNLMQDFGSAAKTAENANLTKMPYTIISSFNHNKTHAEGPCWIRNAQFSFLASIILILLLFYIDLIRK